MRTESDSNLTGDAKTASGNVSGAFGPHFSGGGTPDGLLLGVRVGQSPVARPPVRSDRSNLSKRHHEITGTRREALCSLWKSI
jgi:hypothetical protein